MIKKCKLCNKEFDKSELTKEHYPAKSLGNYDLVRINLLDVLDDIIKTLVNLVTLLNLVKDFRKLKDTIQIVTWEKAYIQKVDML